MAFILAAEFGNGAQDDVVSADLVHIGADFSHQDVEVFPLQQDELAALGEFRRKDVEGLFAHRVILLVVENAFAVLGLVGEAADGHFPLDGLILCGHRRCGQENQDRSQSKGKDSFHCRIEWTYLSDSACKNSAICGTLARASRNSFHCARVRTRLCSGYLIL